MKEVLYCMDRDYLEGYLKSRASCTLDDLKEIEALWTDPIPEPGTDAAVNEIYSVQENTARIKIEGPLSPDGPDRWDRFFGYRGCSYKTIQACMDKAGKDPYVQRVVLDINSPGGTLNGCDETWEKYKALAGTKPCETHVVNMLASAAYWIASPSHKIFASCPTDDIGSVGVLVATYDWSQWEEKIGVKEVVITSSNAPDKYPDVATQEGRDTIKKRLDAFERIFYSRVAEGRGVTNEHIAEHFGRGGLVVAKDPSAEHEDAIRAKMIDGLTTDTAGINTGESDVEAQGEATNPSYEEKNTPANAGQMEDKAMTLSEFLAQNPSAKAELDAIEAKAKAAGRDEAKAEYTASVERVMPIITSKAYPDNVKTLAGDVLAGKKGIDAFDAAVTVYETTEEFKKSKDAQAQTAEQGGVVPEAPDLKGGEEKAVSDAWGASIADAKARAEKTKQGVR